MEENNNDELDEVIKTLKQIENEENKNTNKAKYNEYKQEKPGGKNEVEDRVYVELAMAVFIHCFLYSSNIFNDFNDINFILPIYFFTISLILFYKNKLISVLLGVLSLGILLVGNLIENSLDNGTPIVAIGVCVEIFVAFVISIRMSKKWKYSEIVIMLLLALSSYLFWFSALALSW